MHTTQTIQMEVNKVVHGTKTSELNLKRRNWVISLHSKINDQKKHVNVFKITFYEHLVSNVNQNNHKSRYKTNMSFLRLVETSNLNTNAYFSVSSYSTSKENRCPLFGREPSSSLKKNLCKMIYTLTGITKRSKYIYYQVCCTIPDGRPKYFEMQLFHENGAKLNWKIHKKILPKNCCKYQRYEFIFMLNRKFIKQN